MDKKEELVPIENNKDYLDVGNPINETVCYEIGGTIYEVATSCQGSETLMNKILRLLKTEI